MPNLLLKDKNKKIEYTEELVDEYVKCLNDPIYFIRNYCYIVNVDKGLIKFDLYDFQEEKVNLINDNRFTIFMESRQAGKTTTAVAYILWYSLFNSSMTIAVLSNKVKSAKGILRRYKTMYESLPLWLQQGAVSWNKESVELENGSSIFTSTTSASGIRGDSCNLVYIDEVSTIPHGIADEFFASVYPTISSGKTSKIVMTSTPKGYNHFWKFWDGAVKGINGFVPMFVPYNKVPGRDKEWVDQQRSALGETKFNQEVLCKFLGSSNTLIGGDSLSKLYHTPKIYQSDDGFDVYESQRQDHIYVMVVDPAQGFSRDNSAFVIIDITDVPYKVVAKYKNNRITTLIFPSIINKIARQYNNSFVLVEVNIPDVAKTLYYDYEYANMLMCHKSKYGKGQTVFSGFGQGTTSKRMGVTTTSDVKQKGCEILKDLIEKNKLIINDADIISEISTFVENGRGSYVAESNYKDDLVMCLVLFSWLSDDAYFKSISDINIRKALYEDRIRAIEQEMTPFGFHFDGTEQEILNF